MTRAVALRNIVIGALIAGVLILAGRAQADVVDAGAGGFVLRETATIVAPPDKVWATLIAPSQWWSPEHSYSHDAANYSLDPHAGGCWCEALPSGGSVEHLHVVFVVPGKALRLKGALGPFQAMGEGVMTFTLTAKQGATALDVNYTIFGYVKGGMTALAPIADSVIAEQVARLKAKIETGSPGLPKPQEAKP